MRNFEERKEEIFRRSQAKIAQRKKTVRRVVLSCVPVALCVGMASGYLALGGFGRSDSAAPEANMSPNYGMVAGSDFEFGNEEICDCPAEAPELAPNTTGADNSKENSPANEPGTAGERRPLYEEEVIEEAAKLIDWEYATVTAEQDPETGEWIVTFWMQNGEDFRKITVGRYGGILESETGTLVGCN